MNKEQFTNYLQNPESLSANSVGELTEIVSRFRYCQSAHILLTINLFKEENILYNTSLKTTSVYAGNRRILKQKIDHLAHKIISQPVTHNLQPVTIVEAPELQEQVEKTSTKKTNTEKTKQELLDKFIKNQPSISRGKETFFSAVEASRKSVVDQENIVSETLAKIYLDQHYFEKAIKIYEKLSLKYPEKSIYFAALIKRAKNEVKS